MRENDMRPSIDTLFRSAAKVYGKKTLGILLSGCTYDGLTGAEEIKKQGGQILVQDPRTSIAAELPLTAIKKGLTDEYYSPEELARQIVRRGVRISQPEAAEEQGVGNSLYF
jgi:two-component system chemotaxis response regulator CheB